MPEPSVSIKQVSAKERGKNTMRSAFETRRFPLGERSFANTPYLPALAFVALLYSSGCEFMKTPFLLKKLNTVGSKDAPSRPPDKVRVARVARSHLADSYFHPDKVAGWMQRLAGGIGRAPGLTPFKSLATCIRELQVRPARTNGIRDCMKAFSDAANEEWGLPAKWPQAPTWMIDSSGTRQKNEELEIEVDAQRFLANLVELASTLVEMERGIGRPGFDAFNGVSDGAKEAAAYIKHRGWRRESTRHNTALVMSGGSANGAFSAGIVYRLLEILQACKGASGHGCPGAKLDLVVGTSTGTLIGAAVDLFFTKGNEKKALELLMHSYTCSVESTLYCAHDAWAWRTFDDLKGLMRFDGVQKLLDKNLPDATFTNATELVATSVRLEDGNIYGESDLDPADAANREQRIKALMASIVIPVFAEPVEHLGPNGTRKGSYVDGGLRSVVPVLEAVNRGASRVLMLSNSTFEPAPASTPAHAFAILFRMLDVLVSSGITEPMLARMRALTRRLVEYRVCLLRTEKWTTAGDLLHLQRKKLCERGNLPADEQPDVQAEAMRPNWNVAPYLQEVATSYRASWFFRPEAGLTSATGYTFSPKQMRSLFLAGVASFHDRCPEVLTLLGIRGNVAKSQCKIDKRKLLDKVEKRFSDEAKCSKGQGELRKCK